MYVIRPRAAADAIFLLLATSLTACSGDSSGADPVAIAGATGDPLAGSGGLPQGGATGQGAAGAQPMTPQGGQGAAGAQPMTPQGGATGQGAAGGQPMTPQGGAEPSGGIGGSSGGTVASGGTAGMEPMDMDTGAGSGGEANADCDPGTILCDGFESFAVGEPPGGAWSATTRGGGAIVVDDERAFSGEKSIHVTGRLNADRAYIIAPVEDSEVAHVRFMMYTASYPASSGVHTRLALLGTEDLASGSPYTSYSLATYNGTAIERVNSIYLRDTGTKLDAENLKNRWVCWEFRIDKTGGVGNVEVNIWVDERDLPLSKAGSASHGMTEDSWDPLVFERFMIGLYGYQSDSQPADFWIDDLVVTPERVHCPDAE